LCEGKTIHMYLVVSLSEQPMVSDDQQPVSVMRDYPGVYFRTWSDYMRESGGVIQIVGGPDDSGGMRANNHGGSSGIYRYVVTGEDTSPIKCIMKRAVALLASNL